MKISKLLNNKCFLIIFILFLGLESYAEDQDKLIDIWNINNNEKDESKTKEVIFEKE